MGFTDGDTGTDGDESVDSGEAVTSCVVDGAPLLHAVRKTDAAMIADHHNSRGDRGRGWGYSFHEVIPLSDKTHVKSPRDQGPCLI